MRPSPLAAPRLALCRQDTRVRTVSRVSHRRGSGCVRLPRHQPRQSCLRRLARRQTLTEQQRRGPARARRGTRRGTRPPRRGTRRCRAPLSSCSPPTTSAASRPSLAAPGRRRARSTTATLTLPSSLRLSLPLTLTVVLTLIILTLNLSPHPHPSPHPHQVYRGDTGEAAEVTELRHGAALAFDADVATAYHGACGTANVPWSLSFPLSEALRLPH